jgi:hypothetical protein
MLYLDSRFKSGIISLIDNKEVLKQNPKIVLFNCMYYLRNKYSYVFNVKNMFSCILYHEPRKSVNVNY